MYTVKINKTGSLVKPPVSERLRSGCVVLRKNEEVGLHCTDGKEEILIILSGTATVIMEQEIMKVTKNHAIFIPKGKNHNIKNASNLPLKYVYIVGKIGEEVHD